MRAVIAFTLTVHVSASAQWIVEDPASIAQNALILERQIEEITQMAKRIEFEVNAAKRFAGKLEGYKFSNIQNLIRDLKSFRNRARAISYSYKGIVHDFERLYGKDGRFEKNFTAWEKQSDDSIKDSMHAQALLENSDAHMNDLDKVTKVKAESEGEAETLNAISEINTIQSKQLADLTHIIGTDARARQSVIMEERAKQKDQRAYEERLMRDFNQHGKSRPLAHFPSLGKTAPQVQR